MKHEGQVPLSREETEEAVQNPGICITCADSVGARMPDGHIYGGWRGRCLLCDEIKGVAAPRDYGRCRPLIDQAIERICQQKEGGG